MFWNGLVIIVLVEVSVVLDDFVLVYVVWCCVIRLLDLYVVDGCLCWVSLGGVVGDSVVILEDYVMLVIGLLVFY